MKVTTINVDAELKVLGVEILPQHLGVIEAERFVAFIQHEKFDYTQWRQNLFEGLSSVEVSRQTMEWRQWKVHANSQG